MIAGGFHSFYVTCLDFGEQVVTLRVGNNKTTTNQYPAVSEATVRSVDKEGWGRAPHCLTFVALRVGKVLGFVHVQDYLEIERFYKPESIWNDVIHKYMDIVTNA